MKTTDRLLVIILVTASILLAACSADKSSDTLHEGFSEVKSVETIMPENVREIYRRSCESCHGIDGRGIVGVAPGLLNPRRRSFDEWNKYLRDPQTVHPVGNMPPVWMLDDEIRLMAEYLADSGR